MHGKEINLRRDAKGSQTKWDVDSWLPRKTCALDCRGLFTASGLDFNVDIHQRHRGWRYSGDARSLGQRLWLHMREFLLHLVRQPAHGGVIEPAGDRPLFRLLHSLDGTLLLQQVALGLNLD